MIKLVLVLISLANLCLANSIFKTDIKLLDYLSTEYDFFANNQPGMFNNNEKIILYLYIVLL